MRFPLLVTCAAASLLWLGCGGSASPAYCEQAPSLTSTRGSCPEQLPDAPFGAPAACKAQAARCSGADQTLLSGMKDCFAALPACTPESPEAFLAAAEGCYARASQLSADCLQAYYPDGVPTRGASQSPDAGRDWDRDGSGAVDVTAVADETSVLLAWSLRGSGEVAEWEVLEETDAGTRVRVGTVPASERSYFQQGLPTGTTRRLFVAGLQADGTLAHTELGGTQPDGGEPGGGDGGTACTFHLQCPEHQVCQDGACAQLACSAGDTTACPGGYSCGAGVCVREAATDGGLLEEPDAGAPTVSQPILSELVEVTTAVPSWTGPREVTGFAANSMPEAVAMDVARQAVALVQDGRPYVHLTEDRGRTWRIRGLDTQGDDVRLAWQPSNQMLFACYTLGTGVRVRRSTDAGRSWDTLHMVDLDVLPPEFGGPAEPLLGMSECAIAPWSEGRVLVVVLEDDRLVARLLRPDLTVESRTLIFDPTPGVRPYAPHKLRLATLPEQNVAHLVFVATRLTSSGLTDTDVYGTRIEPGLSAWASPSLVSAGGNKGEGSPNPEDFPSVTIDPVSKRAVAAYVVYEPDVSEVSTNNVYVSVWVPGNSTDPTHRWAPSGELDVFDYNPTSRLFRVMTERKADGSVWEAFAPTVVATGSGQVSLVFMAGQAISSQPTRFQPYVVGVDLAARNGYAWFLPPAQKLSEQRPRVQVRPPFLEGALVGAADALLSTHVFLNVGSDTQASVSEETVQYSRP